ncbi:MAG: hypothetical protein PVJ39_09930 [Gammaproteobacteria bacterium]|jgi:hypothetical protein
MKRYWLVPLIAILFIILPVQSLAAATDLLSTGQKTTIEHESFGVLYESPTFTNKGLILFVDNDRCVAKYRVVLDEIVIGSGQLNARAKERLVPFGITTLRFDCDMANALVITRE